MKLRTTLALSLIAAVSGLTIIENRAMDVPQPQLAGVSRVYIKNDSNWPLEVFVEKTVAEGGVKFSLRLGEGMELPLGLANTLKKIEYGTYGELYEKARRMYELDFKKDLQEGEDLRYRIKERAVAEALTGVASELMRSINENGWRAFIPSEIPSLPSEIPSFPSGWEVEVQHFAPGLITKVQGEKEIASIGLWAHFPTKAQELFLKAKEMQLEAYRIMMNLGTKYTFVDLENSYKALSERYNPADAQQDNEADEALRENISTVLAKAYVALKQELSK